MASKCRKFIPNMFNKSKCQGCFGSKEAHSAAALENNKGTRKVSKCGYLFVAPNFDFSNPVDRTRRWQRRFFRLYDDGELTFCVDENMDTVPQGSVDMNLCTDILEAEVITSHCHSLAVVTPDKTEYIKADSKEEIQWWHDVLVKFPNSLKALKTRRKPNYVINNNKENVKPTQNEENAQKPPLAPGKSETPSSEKGSLSPQETPDLGAHSTFRGVRSLKHKTDKDHHEGLRKSSSLHDLTSEDKAMASSLASSRVLSSSGDHLDAGDGDDEGRGRKPEEGASVGSPTRMPRHSCPSSLPSGDAAMPVSQPSSVFNSSSSLSSTSSNNSTTSRTKARDQAVQNTREPAVAGLKDLTSPTPLPRESASAESGERRAMSLGSSLRTDADDLSQTVTVDETDSNETDELKDLVYMKKGWLIKQGSSDRESEKHWFVLTGNALAYYRDAKAEENNSVDGRIDLSTCYEVSEVTTSRNYGIQIKTRNGEYTLAAMTAGIRSNWMKALHLCMELHSCTPRLPGLTTTLTGLPPHAGDDVDTAAGASAVTGTKGETAFQLVGRRDPAKKENRNLRRPQSDAGSAGEGLKGFLQLAPHSDNESDNKSDSSSATSKVQRYSSSSTESVPWSHSGGIPLKRYVEGSDGAVAAPGLQSAESRRSKRNITSENAKEEEKREMTLFAKSPNTRVKEKSRAAKTPRLHSPPPSDENFDYHRSSGSGQGDSSQGASEEDSELNRTVSSEEHYHSCGEAENQEDSQHDSLAEGSMMVEILESEVESLKERLDQTQSELVKMHETNIDLKTRLQKEAAQMADSSYGSGHGGRWSQSSNQQTDTAQTLKRQLKEARDTVQKQRIEIESLKSKLDMSVSKLTGTEKALSEALREYKQEKDKFLKMSSEWNRRIRLLEGQVKDSTHKQERIRESLLNKERECRRLESEAKQHQQKSREQDREILKLKAVENEYNQLKEQLDNRDRDLHNAHIKLHDKDSMLDKIRAEYDQQLREMENEFHRERDDLENHLEDLKKRLHSAKEQHSSKEKDMTTNVSDLLKEKDEIIAQLEEKLIEHDTKMVDMQEELQAEMGENSELTHNLDILKEEKRKLQERMASIEAHVHSLKSQVVDLETDNTSLGQKLDNVQQENLRLGARLKETSASSDPEKRKLEETVRDLNKQIQGLQLKLMERLEDLDNTHTETEQEDVLHKFFFLESDLKEVNHLLSHLQTCFSKYVSSLSGEGKQEASGLSDMVDRISQRCAILQKSLQEGSSGMPPGSGGDDYHHNITVSASSSGSVILAEYRNLKKKFDRVVAEVTKLKKEVNEVYSSYDALEKKDKQLQEKLTVMEKAHNGQVRKLDERVDNLTKQLASQHPEHAPTKRKPSTSSLAPQNVDTERMLSNLEDKIQAIERTLTSVSSDSDSVYPGRTEGQTHSTMSTGKSADEVSRLKSLHQQLDNINRDLKDILRGLAKAHSGLSGDHQDLASRVDKCSAKLIRLVHSSHDRVKTSHGNMSSGEGGPNSAGESIHNASGMGQCLQTVMDRLQEIGEQLDCIEDQNDDTDDEGEASSIEEVREHLASLCEFVKQHSAFSDLDWRMMQLVGAQKAIISRDRLQAGSTHTTTSMNKLQAYADRLSIEAVILVEMAHLLERQKSDKVQDPLLHEMSMLNSEVLLLHQKLDQEMKTLNETETSADVLRVLADITAEKIMLEGHLHHVDKDTGNGESGKETTEENTSETSQPRVLAAEVIMRSQLDSYIGQNLDSSCDELWTSASHLTTRSLIQGELTFALNALKKQFTDSVLVQSSAASVRDLYLQWLKDRHKAVMEVAEAYQQKMILAFATIIYKESENLTIMEGSDSVLDTVCSEISSVMEKHIQDCKVKVRTAQHTQTAHRWDMMVNQLREDRERVLAGIRQRHKACAGDKEGARKLDIPCQSLDSSITGFGEVVSLQAVVCAHLHFLLEQVQIGDSSHLEETEEEEDIYQTLQSGLCSFVHSLAVALQEQAEDRRTQVQQMLTDKVITAASIPNIPHPKTTSPYNDALMREAVFAAQTTFMIYKLKLLHEQEMEALKMAHPARRYRPRQSVAGSRDADRDMSQTFGPLGEVVEAKHRDDMGTMSVIASWVDRFRGVVGTHDWKQVEEQVKQLAQKVREEMDTAEQRHQQHVAAFREEQKKVEQVFDDCQKEHDHFEERCAALEVELHSMSHEHDDEVERMRQDVLTAVSAIRANEGQSETQLSDKLQLLTKQMSLQKDMYMRFLEHLKSQVSGSDKAVILDLLDKQLKDIGGNTAMMDTDSTSPMVSHTPPSSPHAEDKGLKMEEELELLKKEKDEALAEETRNTKAALDAMRKAYEEELQQERAKYRECLLTMYNEEFVNEIRNRHRAELEKTKEELTQTKTNYLGKCEDLKLLEIKIGQIKQDYEAHINKLVMSNLQIDEMVNKEIDRLKDFTRKRTSSTSATMEEELYDAQITVRVKDTELQKLRCQVKNLEDSLHHTTEEHRQTMTQYLQALKENQELRKEYHTETSSLQEQLDRMLSESGLKKPVKRAPSFHQRTRSPSPAGVTPRRRDCASTSSERSSHDSHQHKSTDLKDLRRSKSSPSLPFVFNAKGLSPAMTLPGKRDRRLSEKI